MESRIIVRAALAILALFSFVSIADAATINKPANFLGMVGYWTFDGPRMTPNVRDSSGQGNHGNLTGQTSTTTVPGKVGQALRFDGVDDYVETGDMSSVEGVTALSVGAWVKTNKAINAGATAGTIIAKDGGGSDTFSMLWDSSERLSFCIEIGTATTYACGRQTSWQNNQGIWHHVVGVYDGTDVRIYVNGVLGDVIEDHSSPTTNSNHTVKIGNSVNTWDGLIDEVRIYNRALSEDEVKVMYNSGTSRQSTVKSPGGLSDDLVGHWTFDGPQMTSNVRDLSSQGAHGRLVGQTSTTSAPGKLGQAIRFDGVDDEVDIEDYAAADPTYAITVSAWVKADQADTSATTIVSKMRSHGGFSGWFLIRGSDERFEFNLRNTGSSTTTSQVGAASASAYADTEWHHVAGVYDGTEVQIYVDGEAADATPSSTTIYLADTDWDICIGATNDNSGNCVTPNFPGLIDDVRIYSRGLSADEVRQLYNLGAGTKANMSTRSSDTGLNEGLIAYWPFNGSDVTDKVYDRSGNGNVGYFRGSGSGTGSAAGTATATAKVSGKIGQGLRFDGTNSNIKIVNDIGDSLSEITVSYWMRSDSAANPGTMISKGRNGSSITSWDFQRNSSGQFQFSVFNTEATEAQASKSGYADTEWHHVVGTYDGLAAQIYIDGVAGTSAALSGDIQTTDSYPLCIGSINGDSTGGCNSNKYKGVLDEVRIYDRALTASEVLQLYNMSK